MKQIIDNVLYDTDKSSLIHLDENKQRRFYKSFKGSYFMCYRTGKIVPYTYDMAKEYLGEVNPNEYIRQFGPVKEA